MSALQQPSNIDARTRDELLEDVVALQDRLAEAEETLRAIRGGEVDALVIGDRLYTLEGIDAASNRFRGEVMGQIDDAVIAIDNDQRITYMNAAAERQYGVKAPDALGYPLQALYVYRWANPDDERRAMQALASTGRWRGQNVHVKRDGEEIHVESTVTLMRDPKGSASGLLAVMRDVSDRVRAEEALRHADRLKDEFLATLAHELRNPLAPIRNALQIMQLSPDAQVHENARGIIDRQLQQMVHLVDDLLDVSRISQGKVELRRQTVDVAAAVQAAIETSRPLIEAGRHELTVRLPPARALMAHADLTRLCQIIANLLNNAAKYTPEGGRIEVWAEREGDDAVVTVQDTGVGIPPSMLPRVFDMFTQVDRSLERSQGGLGIGLALVKRLIEMHGGSVQAYSEGDGKGSRFALRIPLLAVESSEGHEPDAHALHGQPSGDIRVLVVDDNVDSAVSLAQVLDILGYQTVTAHDGSEAVRLAASYAPHAVLLDIGLPRMSGLDAARLIRQQESGGKMLLIALSGWGQDEDRRRSKNAGFDHHFVKPIDIESLNGLLAELRRA